MCRLQMKLSTLAMIFLLADLTSAGGKRMMMHHKRKHKPVRSVQIGDRPFWLVDQMKDSFLKRDLGTKESCLFLLLLFVP